jgi:hypothetical protein
LPRRASSLMRFRRSKNSYEFFSRLIPSEFDASEKP